MSTINLEKARISGGILWVVQFLVVPLLMAQAFFFNKERELRRDWATDIRESEVRQALEREKMGRLVLAKVEFVEWKAQDRARDDQRFYSLLNAIRRVDDRLELIRNR